jgi:hypothetical protein
LFKMQKYPIFALKSDIMGYFSEKNISICACKSVY